MIKIGIIGVGRIGKMHARNIANHIDNAVLVAISDMVENSAVELAKELGVPKVYDTAEDLIMDSDVEAVLICSSTDTHADLIAKAAAAGKHIFCEKPLALDLDAINTSLEAVANSGVILQVGFHRRFDPTFQQLKESLTEDVIGQPWLLKITSYDPAPPPISYIQVSGGLFLDMAIHDFDMARFLLGEVEEVYAAGSVLVNPEIGKVGDIDTAVVTLRFKSEAIGVITNSRKATYGHDQRIEILGEKGGLFAGNPLPHMAVTADNRGYHSPPLHYFFIERYKEAYIAELEAFIRAVEREETPPVTGLDGKIPVVMGYAAKRSLKEGRPVKLSEIDPSLP